MEYTFALLKPCLKSKLWGQCKGTLKPSVSAVALHVYHYTGFFMPEKYPNWVSTVSRIQNVGFIMKKCGSLRNWGWIFQTPLFYSFVFFSILYLFLHFCQELHFKMKTGFHTLLSTLHPSPWIARIKDNFSLMTHTVTKFSKSCPIKRHTLPGSSLYWSYCINPSIG